MKSLKELFEKEIHISMLFTSIGVAFTVSLIVLSYQFKNLVSEINLVQRFLVETTQNALILNEPLSIQRSINEFWKSLRVRSSAINSIKIHFDDTLVSQVGSETEASFANYSFLKCFPTSKQKVCLSFNINLVSFLFEIIVYLFAIACSTAAIYFLRKSIASRKISQLTYPLELEVKRIGVIIEEFKNVKKDEAGACESVETRSERAVIPILEVQNLTLSYNELIEHKDKFNEMAVKTELSRSFSNLASQVSHDIRSPLSALNMVTATLDQVPEEKRVLIRNSVQRINDIANQLLQVGRKQNESLQQSQPYELSTVLIPSLIEYLISEKRVQFREKPNVSIESDLTQGYGLFTHVDPNELKRVLSNLINNSVEAFENETGKVTVALRDDDKDIIITVTDNGKGIPQHILDKLGEQGVSHGKEGTQSGSGLGVYHAKSTIEKFNGKFNIQSKEGQGTVITITLPKTQPPKWFVAGLNITPNQTIVVLDDDISIHGIWKGRLQSLNAEAQGVSLISFTSGAEFKSWVRNQANLSKVLFLIDFELLNQKQTGLDLIEELKLKANLVTSRFEEKSIISRCESLGIGLVPKGMASLLPMQIAEPPALFDWILIDDDPLVHMTWNLSAKDQGKKFKGFSSFEEFKNEHHHYDRSSRVYIDANLSNGVRGEDVAEKVSAMGFSEIFIATGYSPEDIRKSPSINGVIGKEPPALGGGETNT